MSDEEVRMIGYMIGDGSCSNMSFTKTDEAVLDDARRCARVLGEDVSVIRKNAHAPYLRFSKVGPVAGLLRKAGFNRSTLSADKRLPLHLGLSDRQLGQLVGALWSTDGCIDTAVTASGSPKLRIIYTSVSSDLCTDIQHALQRLGLVSNVRTTSVSYKGERRPVSTVQVVSRASKRRFLGLVREGVIPVLRTCVTLDEAVSAIPTSPQGDDTRMQPHLDDHIWWDRVTSNTDDGEEQTFDLEVPILHTFVVDGIVTHNTSSADIRPGSAYWKRLILDSQVSNYLDAAKALGVTDLRGVIYDVVKKPAKFPLKATPVEARKYTEPKSRVCKECKKKNPAPLPHVEDGVSCVDGRIVTDPGGRLYANMRDADETPEEYRERLLADIAEHPEEYFARGEVVRLDDEEIAAAQDVWAIAERIRASQTSGRWPRNVDACDSYGSFCPYWPVCTGETTIDDPTRYRDSDEHEELEGVSQDAGTVEPDAVGFLRGDKKRLPLITTSSMKSYRSCPRKYFYAYELRRRPVETSDALRFGTLIHRGLEAWWKTASLDAALAALDGGESTDPFERVRAECLMLGYHARWIDEPFEVLAVEHEFRTELVNPDTGRASRTWERGGKMDAIARVVA